MSARSTRGDSLVELIVALVVLELAGAAALAAALTTEQLDRRAARGEAADVVRWQDYRVAETAGSCITAALPDTIVVTYPATAERPSLATLVRCGR
jgi:hypothetical protein